MKRCKHERADWFQWFAGAWRQVGTIGGVSLDKVAHLFDRLTCPDCGHWLSLGPARDDGEHAASIRIEIAAARLIAGWETNDSDDTLDDPLCRAVLAHMTGFATRPIAPLAQEVYDLHNTIATHEEP